MRTCELYSKWTLLFNDEASALWPSGSRWAAIRRHRNCCHVKLSLSTISVPMYPIHMRSPELDPYPHGPPLRSPLSSELKGKWRCLLIPTRVPDHVWRSTGRRVQEDVPCRIDRFDLESCRAFALTKYYSDGQILASSQTEPSLSGTRSITTVRYICADHQGCIGSSPARLRVIAGP